MEPGDLVKVYNRKTGLAGMGYLIKRTYLTYEARYCRWLVMFNGEAIEMSQRHLHAIKPQA